MWTSGIRKLIKNVLLLKKNKKKKSFLQNGKFKQHYLKSSHFSVLSEKGFQEFSLFLRTLVANFDGLKAVFSFL